MRLALTIGDCNGIGLEVLLKALKFLKNKLINRHKIFISGNSETIYEYAKKINFPLKFNQNNLFIDELEIDLINCSNYSQVEFGKLSREAGALAGESIEKATEFVISGNADGLVTMPINKKAIYLADWEFPGHTEYLAHKARTPNYLMIICDKKIRVALVTIHLPLSSVSKILSIDIVIDKIVFFRRSLKIDFGIRNPRLAVLGLNPHAGENGALGDEEIKVIKPAIERAKEQGIEANGPFPADGFFAHQLWREFDGVLAMYHDQGLIPAKMITKGNGVNFTAGLSFIRTSVDHGTAFEIAGRNLANPKSAINAIEFCLKFIRNRKNNTD